MASFLFPSRAMRTRNNVPGRRDEYSRNYRSYYLRDASPRKKRAAKRSRYCLLLLYIVGFFMIAAKLTRGKENSSSKRKGTGNDTEFKAEANPLKKNTGEQGGSKNGDRQAGHVPVDGGHIPIEIGMRPPQFGAHGEGEMSARDAIRILDDALVGTEDELDVADESLKTGGGAIMRASYSGAVSARRDGLRGGPHVFKKIKDVERGTRTCYHSSVTGDGLCVHVPFCVRHSSIVYLGGRLRCGIYSNKQGKLGTLGMGRCVELERDVENVGEIEQVEHKEEKWLESLERDGNVLWFDGDSVFVRMGPRCKSVTHFADRIFMLHHVLLHPERYGMGAVSNVVIAADEQVAKKIRYSKSWHHGLLAAIVYPNRIVYSSKTIRELVTSLPSTPGEIRVFVPNGLWDIAKGRLVPCFRRAALPGSVRNQFFLTEDVYPGVVDQLASSSRTRHVDADVFRTQLFLSLGHEGVPRIKKEILYLHRATTRSFNVRALALFETKMRAVGQNGGFAYRMLDVAGMTFPQQIEAVAGAGVVVGIHGTQMLNAIFLPSGSSMLEIFPYQFMNRLFEGGSGAGLHYAKHQILHGDDYPELGRFHGVENCFRVSSECRAWYQSDRRKLGFEDLDAAVVGNLLMQAMEHVEQSF